MTNPSESEIVVKGLTSNALAAEASVIGSILFEWECAVDVMAIIQPGDFYEPNLRIAAQKLWAMYEDGVVGMDLVIFRDAMGDKIDEMGGVDYLVKIAESTPTSANALHYAKIVKKHSRQIQIKQAAADMVKLAGAGGDPDKIIGKMADMVDDLNTVDEDGIYTFEQALLSTVTAAPEEPIKTGFYVLDGLSPVLPGDFVVIGARPSHGKTALALEMATFMAMEYGEEILFFSAEMSHQRLTSRAMQYQIGTEWRENALFQCEIADLPLTIIDKSYLTTKVLRNVVKAQMKKKTIKAIFIDHFHLMTHSGRSHGTVDELTSRSLDIRLMAKSLNVATFLLAQLNRKVESRDSKRPRMSDLRGTGAIEQDATAIWMLHRVDQDNKFDENYTLNHEAHIYIDKHRDGATGRVTLHFDQDVFTFKNRSM